MRRWAPPSSLFNYAWFQSIRIKLWANFLIELVYLSPCKLGVGLQHISTNHYRYILLNLVWCILPALLQELKRLDLSNNEFKKITLPESKFLFEEMFMLGKTRILFEWKCWLAHLWNKKTPSPFSRVIGQYVPYALHWSMCLCMWLYASSYVRLCIHAHTDTHLRFPAQT